MSRLLLIPLGALLPPLLFTQCGGTAPDYTPIGDSIKFAGVCVVVAVLVIALAGLISDSSSAEPD